MQIISEYLAARSSQERETDRLITLSYKTTLDKNEPGFITFSLQSLDVAEFLVAVSNAVQNGGHPQSETPFSPLTHSPVQPGWRS
jgi:hypothetical protein